MCLQATFDAAASRFHIGATLFDVGSTFLCNCFSLLHRPLACLREIVLFGLHALIKLAAAGRQLPAISFDIPGASFDRRSGRGIGRQ
jgi:hypothetical protein